MTDVLPVWVPELSRSIAMRTERSLPRLEASRWRARRRLLNIWRRLEALAVRLLELGGEAHAKNKYGEWLLYRAEKSPGPEDPEWVTWYQDSRVTLVDAPKHADIGQQLHDLMTFCWCDNGRRRLLTEAALEQGIQRALAPQVKRQGRVARLPVNGRDYWYQCVVHSSGHGRWNRMLWPEDDIVVVCEGSNAIGAGR